VSLARKVDNLFGVAAEIPNGGIDLPESNLHTFSVNRPGLLRQLNPFA
jgi:hypothetical protein